MNSNEFVLQEVDRLHIKEEQDLIIEDRQNVWESTPKYVAFEIDSAKCGEVMIAREGRFTFVCSLCMERFSDLKTFGTHIRDLHMKTELQTELEKELIDNASCIEVKSANPKSLDEEVFIIESSDDDVWQRFSASGNHSSQSDRLTDTVDKDCEQYDPLSELAEELATEIEIPIDSNAYTTKSPELALQTCKYCDQQFAGPLALRKHVLSHKGPNRFVCPYCPKTFVSTTTRRNHVYTHTGERPHKCPHCPKGFADRTNLQMHIRAHLQICKYSCSYCDKRFVQSGSKKLHERTHTGEKPYQCEQCGKRFIAQTNLTLHRRTHSNIKNYKCKICGMAFHSFKRIKDHMTVHTGERPYHCSICGQNFPRRKSLRTHQELHSDVKKYVCGICGKAFAQFAGLYSHRKTHGEIAE